MSDDELDLDEVISGDEDLVEEEMIGKAKSGTGGRQRVEAKLEELRMQRMNQDYDFI